MVHTNEVVIKKNAVYVSPSCEIEVVRKGQQEAEKEEKRVKEGETVEDLIVAINADNLLILRDTEKSTAIPWTGINGLITIVIFVTR